MKKILFKSDKNMYKANLHCHTTFSDGDFTPEKIKEIYKNKGYSIVAFTDHSILVPQSQLNDETFLAINSCEVDILENAPGKPWPNRKTFHFNLYATNPGITQTPVLPDMDYNDIAAINKYIRDRSGEGFLVCYNHPYWSLQDYSDFGKLEGLFAMEIYNHGCESEGYYGYHPQAYDEMLRTGNALYCVSADDNHNRYPVDGDRGDSFGGFVMINSGSLSYQDIISSLKSGDFYSSQGPEIYEVSLEDNKLYVHCSEASAIVVFTDSRKCYFKRGDRMTEGEIELDGKDKYIRVMVRDNEKMDANTNAFWL